MAAAVRNDAIRVGTYTNGYHGGRYLVNKEHAYKIL